MLCSPRHLPCWWSCRLWLSCYHDCDLALTIHALYSPQSWGQGIMDDMNTKSHPWCPLPRLQLPHPAPTQKLPSLVAMRKNNNNTHIQHCILAFSRHQWYQSPGSINLWRMTSSQGNYWINEGWFWDGVLSQWREKVGNACILPLTRSMATGRSVMGDRGSGKWQGWTKVSKRGSWKKGEGSLKGMTGQLLGILELGCRWFGQQTRATEGAQIWYLLGAGPGIMGDKRVCLGDVAWRMIQFWVEETWADWGHVCLERLSCQRVFLWQQWVEVVFNSRTSFNPICNNGRSYTSKQDQIRAFQALLCTNIMCHLQS